MKTIVTEIYKDARELLYSTPIEGNKIKIENEDEVIKAIRNKILQQIIFFFLDSRFKILS